MPISGGLSLLAILLINFLYLKILNDHSANFFIDIFFFSFCFFIFGFIDDTKGFQTNTKVLIILFLIILILFYSNELIIKNLNFYYIFKKTFVLDIFAIPFTIFCIFMLFNALNFADGKNGFSIALSIYWLFYLMFKISSDIFFVIGLITILIIVLYFNL